MSAENDSTGMSKSARKRANKKAREAAEVQEEEPAPVPAAKPKAKAAVKESAPEPKAKAKAKAEPQSAEPKGKAKAKAEPKQAEAAQAKPAAKSKGAAKASAKAAAAKPAEEEKQKDALLQPVVFDDGMGGEWETSSGLSKKMQRSKERREAKKAEEEKAEQEKKEQEIAAAKAKKAAEKAAAAAAGAPAGKAKAKGKAKAEAKAAEPDAKEAAPAKAAAPAVANASVSPAAVAQKTDEPKEEPEKDILHTAIVKVPDSTVSRIIGPKGSTMMMIKEKTGIVNLEFSGDDCILTGKTPEDVAMAEVCVNEIIEKGYTSLAWDNPAEAKVPFLKSEIANVIGKGGDTIRVIKEQCKVEINIPKTDKDPKADPGAKIKISVAGSTEDVEKAKECIESIGKYGHHELTHPGVEHKELEIPDWQYAFIIGSKGSEMRHIQNNFEVKVNIPREHSAIQNVLVIGEGRNVDRACAYIEKILKEKSEPRGRDKPEKAEDTWGEDGPIEPWMKAYMVKR